MDRKQFLDELKRRHFNCISFRWGESNTGVDRVEVELVSGPANAPVIVVVKGPTPESILEQLRQPDARTS